MDLEHVPAVTEIKETIIEEEKFILTLNREEAEIISLLVGDISGDEEIDRPRRICGSIYSVLSRNGVRGWENYTFNNSKIHKRSHPV